MKKFIVLIFALLLVLCWPLPTKAAPACFVVTAFNDFGESDQSQEVCCNMTEPGDKAALSWNSVLGADGYRLYYKPPWLNDYVPEKCIEVTETTVMVFAVDIFKLGGLPVLIIQCE